MTTRVASIGRTVPEDALGELEALIRPSADGQESAALVRPAGGRVASLLEAPGFAVITPAGNEFLPARRWLLDLHAKGYQQASVRSYANSLARYLYFLWDREKSWASPVEAELEDFARWAVHAGSAAEGGPYSKSTVDQTVKVARAFFAFCFEEAPRPSDPPVTSGRVVHTRVRRRGKVPRSSRPRPLHALSPDELDRFFWSLGNNRDRAIVGVWATTDIRAQEMVALRSSDLDLSAHTITVVRNGVVVEDTLPMLAMIWIGLYLVERGPMDDDEPLWIVLRATADLSEALKLNTFRSVLTHAQDLLLADGHTMDDLGPSMRRAGDLSSSPALTFLAGLLQSFGPSTVRA